MGTPPPGNLRKYGAKCLDAEASGPAPGTRTMIWDCHGGQNQQGNVNASGTLTSARSGLCLDAYNSRTANGTQAVLWTCNGGSNRWDGSRTSACTSARSRRSSASTC
ncbi:RICIN domain-containing protein [Streptomyces coeruleorubidus]|uniref:RICIN domain-containing protein n=1 Tax=Streptomyces coeruleorubidus TaxID=116188 RepID=UPI0037F26A24